MGTQTLEIANIADTAIVDASAQIGKGTKIWAFVQIGERASIGENCVIGNGAYVDRHVKIGNRVRIHNKALLYHGLVVEDDVFIGPAVCFANDKWPRSGLTRNLKGKSWIVRKGASIGANATILPDLEIGAYALVGAGAVVTKSVPKHAIVAGNPAKLIGYACSCGQRLLIKKGKRTFECSQCAKTHTHDKIRSSKSKN